MQEIWKDIYFVDKGIIYDYRNLYQVSNMGRIRKILFKNRWVEKKKEKILKFKINNWGYYEVTLSKTSKVKTFRVNRIVAKIFIPNPNNYLEVNHINGIKIDNRVENLEWCTRSKNLKHSFEIGLRKPSTPMKGKRGKETGNFKEILQYDLKGNLIKKWECIALAQRVLGINNISACCRKKRKKAGGYKWEYANER